MLSPVRQMACCIPPNCSPKTRTAPKTPRLRRQPRSSVRGGHWRHRSDASTLRGDGHRGFELSWWVTNAWLRLLLDQLTVCHQDPSGFTRSGASPIYGMRVHQLTGIVTSNHTLSHHATQPIRTQHWLPPRLKATTRNFRNQFVSYLGGWRLAAGGWRLAV